MPRQSLAQDQTELIAPIPRGATVNGGAAAIVVLRDVRGHVEVAHVSNEAAIVEQLAGTDCDAVLTGHGADYRRRRFCLSRAARPGELGIGHQATAVLHHRMAHVAQPGRSTRRLLVEAHVGTGGRGVCLVAQRLAPEVARAVAAGPGGSVILAGEDRGVLSVILGSAAAGAGAHAAARTMREVRAACGFRCGSNVPCAFCCCSISATYCAATWPVHRRLIFGRSCAPKYPIRFEENSISLLS